MKDKKFRDFGRWCRVGKIIYWVNEDECANAENDNHLVEGRFRKSEYPAMASCTLKWTNNLVFYAFGQQKKSIFGVEILRLGP